MKMQIMKTPMQEAEEYMDRIEKAIKEKDGFDKCFVRKGKDGFMKMTCEINRSPYPEFVFEYEIIPHFDKYEIPIIEYKIRKVKEVISKLAKEDLDLDSIRIDRLRDVYVRASRIKSFSTTLDGIGKVLDELNKFLPITNAHIIL